MKFFKLRKENDLYKTASCERNTQAAMKKEAFKIKNWGKGLSLVVCTKEKDHPNTPHVHLCVGEGHNVVVSVFVNDCDKHLDYKEDRYYQDFKKLRELVDNNKALFTQIYYAKDGNKIKELAKQLPR